MAAEPQAFVRPPLLELRLKAPPPEARPPCWLGILVVSWAHYTMRGTAHSAETRRETFVGEAASGPSRNDESLLLLLPAKPKGNFGLKTRESRRFCRTCAKLSTGGFGGSCCNRYAAGMRGYVRSIFDGVPSGERIST